jgi:hypothetical protein
VAKGSLLGRRAPVRRRAPLIVAVGVVAALTGAAGARSSAPKATPPVRLTATSQAIAAATPRGPSCAPACASPLVFRGGPVQFDPRVYLVFWGPKWFEDSAGIVPALQGLFGHLSHSPFEQVLAQYRVGDVVSLAGSWIDTQAPVGVVTRGDVLGEAVRALRENHSWTNDGNTQIVVLPENGTTLTLAADTAPTPTEDTDYCGWHYYGPSATYGRIVYTLLPYLAQKRFRSGCISYGHGNLRDAMTTVESHEFAESATDPTLNGWTTDQGTGSDEIGDLCAYPGVHVPLGPPEEVQLLWSNQDNRCEPVPTLAVDPEAGPPSTQLVVTGDNFGADEKIDLQFSGVPAASASADAAGSFTARLRVPAGAREGYYLIQATGEVSGHVSTASFDVVTDAWPQLGFDAAHSADNPAPTPLDATTASHLEVAWTGSTDGHHSANPFSTGQVVVGDGLVVEGTADATEHDG